MIASATLFAASCNCLQAAGSAPWNVAEFKKVPASFPAPEIAVDGLRSVFLEGPHYEGKPTKFFAFYGIPKLSPGKKAPGIVLVHGGGGTAFAEWVKLWVSHGYAAIAIDHGGRLPLGQSNVWKPNPDGGPMLDPTEGQINLPLQDQWMYHAVGDTMLAYSFLASLPEVDSSRIGLMGISWGGVVSSTVAGLDDRAKFFILVYGCGFLSYDFHDGTMFLNSSYPAEDLQKWQATWDPANYLAGAKAPMLWLTSSNDFAFTLNALQHSYRLAPAPKTLAVKLRMPHGHEGPARDSPEIFAFADSIAKRAEPLPEVARQGKSGNTAWVDVRSKSRISSATLCFTLNEGRWQNRVWQEIPARIEAARSRVEAEVPEDAKAYFFNVVDARGLAVSSEHVVSSPTRSSNP